MVKKNNRILGYSGEKIENIIFCILVWIYSISMSCLWYLILPILIWKGLGKGSLDYKRLPLFIRRSLKTRIIKDVIQVYKVKTISL